MKKFRRSAITIITYIIAAGALIYCIYLGGSTIKTINDYYAEYGMTAQFGETFLYLLQNCLIPFVLTVLVFLAGYISDEVRKLNPANWLTAEELEEAKEAKRAAKEAKQAAKNAAEVVELESAVEEAEETAEEVEEAAEEAEAAAEETVEEVEEAAEEAEAAAEETVEEVEDAVGEAEAAAEETAEEVEEAAEKAEEEVKRD